MEFLPRPIEVGSGHFNGIEGRIWTCVHSWIVFREFANKMRSSGGGLVSLKEMCDWALSRPGLCSDFLKVNSLALSVNKITLEGMAKDLLNNEYMKKTYLDG